MPENKIEEIVIHIGYEVDGEYYEDEQNFAAERVAPSRFRLWSSSGFMADYILYYGDEIVVEPIGNNTWQFVSLVEPSAMSHFFCIASAPPKSITKILHRMGGEWECDMGGITHFHIPTASIEEFSEETGIRFDQKEAVHSGLRNLDFSDV